MPEFNIPWCTGLFLGSLLFTTPGKSMSSYLSYPTYEVIRELPI